MADGRQIALSSGHSARVEKAEEASTWGHVIRWLAQKELAPKAKVDAVCQLTTLPADMETPCSKSVGCTAEIGVNCHDRCCYAKERTHLNNILQHDPTQGVEHQPSLKAS